MLSWLRSRLRARSRVSASEMSLDQLRMLERCVEHAEYCPTSCDLVRARQQLAVLRELVRRRIRDREAWNA